MEIETIRSRNRIITGRQRAGMLYSLSTGNLIGPFMHTLSLLPLYSGMESKHCCGQEPAASDGHIRWKRSFCRVETHPAVTHQRSYSGGPVQQDSDEHIPDA
jgi:hypothetical protein